VIFEQKGVRVPKLVGDRNQHRGQQYFYGKLETPERETGVDQLVRRIVKTITAAGIAQGYSTRRTPRSSPMSWRSCSSINTGHSILRCGSTWAATSTSPTPRQEAGTGVRCTRIALSWPLSMVRPVTRILNARHASSTPSEIRWKRSWPWPGPRLFCSSLAPGPGPTSVLCGPARSRYQAAVSPAAHCPL